MLSLKGMYILQYADGYPQCLDTSVGRDTVVVCATRGVYFLLEMMVTQVWIDYG